MLPQLRERQARDPVGTVRAVVLHLPARPVGPEVAVRDVGVAAGAHASGSPFRATRSSAPANRSISSSVV